MFLAGEISVFPFLRFFLDIIIVSVYCLKLLSSKNCAYWIEKSFQENYFRLWCANCRNFFLGLKMFFHFCFDLAFYFKINLKGENGFSNIWKVSKRNSIDKFIFQLVLELVNRIVKIIVSYVCRRIAVMCSSICCCVIVGDRFIAIKHCFWKFL